MCVIFSSFLVHFVPNIPDDHMITIWIMLRTVLYAYDNFTTIERFELPKVLPKVTNHESYRLDENRMFTNGFQTLNTLFYAYGNV